MTEAPTKKTPKEAVLAMLSSGTPITYRDLRKAAKASAPIQELIDEGSIVRLPLGLYALPDRDTSWDALSAVAVRYPKAVICGSSAAAYHGLTAENPYEVWAAFPYKASIPKNSDISIRGFRWQPPGMTIGVETVDIGNTLVKMTSPERTVVDYLRFMNQSGETELALEALSNFRGNHSDLIKIARKLGAEKSVLPYVQAAMGFGRKM